MRYNSGWLKKLKKKIKKKDKEKDHSR